MSDPLASPDALADLIGDGPTTYAFEGVEDEFPCEVCGQPVALRVVRVTLEPSGEVIGPRADELTVVHEACKKSAPGPDSS